MAESKEMIGWWLGDLGWWLISLGVTPIYLSVLASKYVSVRTHILHHGATVGIQTVHNDFPWMCNSVFIFLPDNTTLMQRRWLSRGDVKGTITTNSLFIKVTHNTSLHYRNTPYARIPSFIISINKIFFILLYIQLKSEVYIHLSQIHLNSVFHNSWHLILVKIPCQVSYDHHVILRMWNVRIIVESFYFFHHIPSGSEVYIHSISIW